MDCGGANFLLVTQLDADDLEDFSALEACYLLSKMQENTGPLDPKVIRKKMHCDE